MDIRCRICGEPWDMDCLHDAAAEQGRTWDEVRKDFYRRGCEALGEPACERDGFQGGAVVGLLMEMLGDDIDGLACGLEDAETFGYI